MNSVHLSYSINDLSIVNFGWLVTRLECGTSEIILINCYIKCKWCSLSSLG